MTFFINAANNLRLPLAPVDGDGLRRAQVAAAHAIGAHFWASSRPALVVMPTGSGKTAVMLLASIMLRPKRVLVIAPSRLLRNQIAEKFETLDILRKTGALEDKIGAPKVAENRRRISHIREWRAFEKADVVVTTPHSASPGMEDIPAPPPDLFDLIIFDEAHHRPAPTYAAIAKAFPNARSVLFTATPFRRDEREIPGELIFAYNIKQARQDGVYGRLRFEPVAPRSSEREAIDRAIAVAAAKQLEKDRARGLKHSILVRAASTERARELYKIYADSTTLKLKQLHSQLTQATVDQAIGDLRSGVLDGVIAVDMLGEGFDFPNLKVAALHAPHRSLAVTLQFIGRFARTSPDTGEATFFAVLDEIKGEAATIYVPGAEWNEIVEEASRDRIAEEAEARTFIKTFEYQPQPGYGGYEDGDLADDTEAWALLRTVRPYFHVKAYHVLGSVNLDTKLQVPRGVRPLLVRRSEKHRALIWVGRRDTPVVWSNHRPWTDVSHDVFIVIHEPTHKHLFICTSRRENSVYDSLVEGVLGDKYRMIAPNEITRVLHGISAPEFFSVGMRNRAGLGGAGSESYRQYSGRSADRAIRVGDGALYDRGHGFARGREKESDVTIGFSSSSKVWANRRGPLIELVAWTKHLSAKLVDAREVATGSGLDYLRSAERVSTFPGQVVAAALPDEAYARESRFVTFRGKEEWLTDFTVEIHTQTSTSLDFSLQSSAITCRFSVALGRARIVQAADAASGSALVTDVNGRNEVPLAEFLNENPVVFYLDDMSVLRGEHVHRAPQREDGAGSISSQIEGVDWGKNNVDPYTEKPPASAGRLSLFEYVERTISGPAEVVFADDGSGEIADYISIKSESTRTLVSFIHCKAASRGRKGRKGTVPNDRVDDLYEVVGQAIKCRRWTDGRRLIAQLRHRMGKSSRFIRGTFAQAEVLLGVPSRLAFEVLIVQPAISTSPKTVIEHLLVAADGYMRGASLLPLRVWGTQP